MVALVIVVGSIALGLGGLWLVDHRDVGRAESWFRPFSVFGYVVLVVAFASVAYLLDRCALFPEERGRDRRVTAEVLVVAVVGAPVVAALVAVIATFVSCDFGGC